MLRDLYAALPAALRADVEHSLTTLLIIFYAMMPYSLAQLLTSIAERLLHDPPRGGPAFDRTERAQSPAESTQVAPSPTDQNDLPQRKTDPEQLTLKHDELKIDGHPLRSVQTSPQFVRSNPAHDQANTFVDLVDSSEKQSANSVTDGRVDTRCATVNSTDRETKPTVNSVATSPMSPRFYLDYSDPKSFAVDTVRNLDWCRWPVCMAYYLNRTCPFGEASCPDAHATSDYAGVINEKGQVRVCFDALGVGGRMCLRRPGHCRFFHAPAHIRYQLLEIRHGNRQAKRRMNLCPLSDQYPCSSVAGSLCTEHYSPTTTVDAKATSTSSTQTPSIELTITVAAAIAALVARLMTEPEAQNMSRVVEHITPRSTHHFSEKNTSGPNMEQSHLSPSNERSRALLSNQQMLDNPNADQLPQSFSTA